MMARAGTLTHGQVERLQAAAGLLRSGRRAEALATVGALAREAGDNSDVQQLLAMCLAETGQDAAAESAFRRAIALATMPTDVAANLARWLGRQGRVGDALQVLSGVSHTVESRLQQGLLALRAGQPMLAVETLAEAVAREPLQAQAWHGLGQGRRALGDWEGAESAFAEATRLAPGDARAWINRAAVLRLLGRLELALDCLAHAERAGYDEPELADLRHGIWHDAGEVGRAIAGARALVRRSPDHVEAQASLAQLWWEHGDGEAPSGDPFAEFLRAAHLRPRHRELHLRLAAMLTAASRADEALELLEPLQARSPDDPVLQWFRADAHARSARHALAGTLYRAAYRRLHRASTAYLSAYARHAFRVGEPELALRCAADAIALDPSDQEAWAHRATAWRLQDDPREYWLCDYERQIAELEVDIPGGYADMAGFLAQLECRLADLHRAAREPLSQSVRSGSQTPGRLFGRNDPLLRDTEQVLRRAVECWVERLPSDPHHPFLSRRSPGIRFQGSWSVRLRSSGCHSNHIHTEGWLSSAFYVALPATVQGGNGESRAGWIQFGQPLEDLGLALEPRRMIRPATGRLILFPSYMWHGTIPFSDVGERLTIAFDALPAAHAR
jgi:Flp pilus assembly protein TadD